MVSKLSRNDMILAHDRMNNDFQTIWYTLLKITTEKRAYKIASLIESGLDLLEVMIDNADWNILNNDKAVM